MSKLCAFFSGMLLSTAVFLAGLGEWIEMQYQYDCGSSHCYIGQWGYINVLIMVLFAIVFVTATLLAIASSVR